MYYIAFDDFAPGGLVARAAGHGARRPVVTRPIAGTRPRGADAAEDERLMADLRADDKERAEHVMLVDLGRNDLGRVCVPGTRAASTSSWAWSATRTSSTWCSSVSGTSGARARRRRRPARRRSRPAP